MRFSLNEYGPIFDVNFRWWNLYETAVSELDDDQLLELVANSAEVLGQQTKELETAKANVGAQKALRDAAKTARMLRSTYEQRMRHDKCHAWD